MGGSPIPSLGNPSSYTSANGPCGVDRRRLRLRRDRAGDEARHQPVGRRRRAFLEYAAYLTRLGLDDLAAHHTDLAAAAGDDGTAEQMSREEAAQVVQQMARRQETQELALQDSQQ